jgi:hypothetical protein
MPVHTIIRCYAGLCARLHANFANHYAAQYQHANNIVIIIAGARAREHKAGALCNSISTCDPYPHFAYFAIVIAHLQLLEHANTELVRGACDRDDTLATAEAAAAVLRRRCNDLEKAATEDAREAESARMLLATATAENAALRASRVAFSAIARGDGGGDGDGGVRSASPVTGGDDDDDDDDDGGDDDDNDSDKKQKKQHRRSLSTPAKSLRSLLKRDKKSAEKSSKKASKSAEKSAKKASKKVLKAQVRFYEGELTKVGGMACDYVTPHQRIFFILAPHTTFIFYRPIHCVFCNSLLIVSISLVHDFHFRPCALLSDIFFLFQGG